MSKVFNQWEEDTKEDVKEKVKQPDMYRVILLNDDYTTMEFVVEILVVVFQKDILSATKIMRQVHEKGAGEVGKYSYDIASSKAEEVHRRAREREFPLKCNVEKV